MDLQKKEILDFLQLSGSNNNTDSNETSVQMSPDIYCWLSSLHIQRLPDVNYCNPVYDLIQCWPMVPENTTVNKSCPPAINAPDDVRAYRTCGEGGEWSSNTSDYSHCIEYMNTISVHEEDTALAIILRDIYFVCSIISLIFLVISLFIFCRFKSLSCSRISIHKQLVVSFIIRFLVLIVMIEPFVLGHPDQSYRNVEWLCKVVSALNQYTVLTNIYWMLVEGLFLHNSIVVAVFSTEEPYKLFVFMGWGLPAIIAIVWAIVTQIMSTNYCWSDNSKLNTTYIIIGPFLAALVINLIFLISIIRVLVTKLRANNTHESSRIKKAIKATVILMPLLGLTNMIFVWNPEDGGTLQIAYHVTNAVLHSTQGIMISCLYCFLNGEVRRVIRRKYNRFKIQRFLKNSGRRRSSRTSSFILSQTEVLELSELASRNRKVSTSSDCTACTTHNTNNNRYQKVNVINERKDSDLLKSRNNSYSDEDIDVTLEENSNKQQDDSTLNDAYFSNKDEFSENENVANSSFMLNGKSNSDVEDSPVNIHSKGANGACNHEHSSSGEALRNKNSEKQLNSNDGEKSISIVNGLSQELTDEFSKMLIH